MLTNNNSSSGWLRYPNFDCPICNGARRDCRQSLSSGLIHCRDSEAKPIDYVFIGEDINGFGMWSSSSAVEEWNEERREERRQQKAREKEERRQRLAKFPSESERDCQYRIIHKALGVNQKHKSDLVKRGLTNEMIDFAIKHEWLTSWKHGATIKGLSSQLAGVYPKSIETPLVGGNGLAIAAINLESQILGYQIANEDRNSGAKYYWLSSEKHGGSSPHLQNGELPLFVWKHPDCDLSQAEVWLVEGALKSLITALKCWFAWDKPNVIVIGSAGGNFSSSKTSFLKEIARIDKPEVKLFPDGGDAVNSNVTKRWKSQLEFMASNNLDVSVAWWNQTEKSDGDIDEIANDVLAKIEWIKPEDFIRLSEKQSYFRSCRNAWDKTKTYKPNQSINQRYFDAPFPQSGTISFIKSGLGTGKTTWLINVLKEINQASISLGYRNTLLLQFCEKASDLRFYHLHEDSAKDLIRDSNSNIANCVDSLGYFRAEDFEGKTLIIDEAISVVKHLLFSPTIKNRRKLINLFSEALKKPIESSVWME